MKTALSLFLVAFIGTLALILINCASTNQIAASMETPTAAATNIENMGDTKPTNDGKRTPVIVELFTSEGCSSCPPADANLSMLVKEQPVAGAEIIGLSEHVDYWNRLGWADPFSSGQFSGRQGEYSQYFKRDDVYTPQIIVNGQREVGGGDMRGALKQIAEAAKEPQGNISIEIAKETGNVLSLQVKAANLPKITSNDSAIVLLAITENNLTSNVARGENGGRRLRHTAVTRYLQNIGSAINGDKPLSADVTLDKDWKRENLNVVAFVQEIGSRKILGAGKIDLKK
ncbi:MAG: DUF1223 domain-containing protein [Pyrinomonadaceae bacterium]